MHMHAHVHIANKWTALACRLAIGKKMNTFAYTKKNAQEFIHTIRCTPDKHACARACMHTHTLEMALSGKG